MARFKFGQRTSAPLPDSLPPGNDSTPGPDALSSPNGMLRPDREQCPSAERHNNNIPRMKPNPKLVCWKILPATLKKPWRIKIRLPERDDQVFTLAGIDHAEQFLTKNFGPLEGKEIQLPGWWSAGIRTGAVILPIPDSREPFLGQEGEDD